MKGLNKLVLASAIAAISAGAQAELKALDDSAMGELTGQAGLTIDLETKWSIGEFAYEDAGFVLIQGMSVGGSEAGNGLANGLLDNIRLTIDITGATPEPLKNGFSELLSLAGLVTTGFGNTDATLVSMATNGTLDGTTYNAALASGNAVDTEAAYGDGDLKIHFGFTDAFRQGGGFAAYAAGAGATSYVAGDGTGQNDGATLGSVTYDQAFDIITKAVDFNFSIDAIGIANEAYGTNLLGTAGLETDTRLNGDAANGTTTLISGLSMNGYLGPADLHIENHGNGFSGGPLGGDTGVADSKIVWGSYARVTDLDLYIDIAGVQLTDITIHNDRGDVTGIERAALGGFGTNSFGFAHSENTIYAVKDAVLDLTTLLVGGNGYVDGVAINNEFKGDIDIGALSFGDTGVSIGSIYMTDVRSTTNWTISAH